MEALRHSNSLFGKVHGASMDEEGQIRFHYTGPDDEGTYTMGMAFEQTELPTMSKIKSLLLSKTNIEVGSISRWVDSSRRHGNPTEHKVRGERSWAQLVNDWVEQKPMRKQKQIQELISKITKRLKDDSDPESQVGAGW